ncbi:MAG: uroporphyrinogen-III synthase [Ideonella sp.]
MQRLVPTVLVTRPGKQALAWVRDLCAFGVDAIAAPLITIAEAPDPAAVDAAWTTIEAWSMFVFVSPNAVSQFFARRPAARAWPPRLRAAAPGPGTSALLLEHGVPAELLVEPAADAPNFDSEALWLQLRDSSWRGTQVLIVRGEDGRGWLAERLREAGAEVRFLAAYSRGEPLPPEPVRQTMQQALALPADHLWFFSSSEAVSNLLQLQLMVDGELRSALSRSRALATHPRIAETAHAAGFGTVLQCRPGLPEVVACIQSLASLDCSSAFRRVT